MALAAGARLGRYEIRSKIGEGGMIEVYRAYNFIFLATKFLVNRLCSRVDSGNSDNAVAIRPAKILVPVTFRGTEMWSLLYQLTE